MQKEPEENLSLDFYDEEIDRLLSKEFDEHFNSFEDFKKDFYEKIDQARQEIKEGKGRPIEEFCKEMEEKYGFTI